LRVLAVLNPSAHDFEARRLWPRLEARLRAAVRSLAVVETEPHQGRTREKIRSAIARGPDRIVAVGGDGTFHDLVNGIGEAGFAQAPPLAIIPFGTANDLAKSLSLPLGDIDRLVAIALGPRLTGLDIVRVRASGESVKVDELWIDSLGVGIDADVVHARRYWRELGGYLGYAAALAERSFEQRSVRATVEVDGRRVEGIKVYNLVVKNIPVYAGVLNFREAIADDGKILVLLLDRVEYASKVVSWGLKSADVLGIGISEVLESITENQRSLSGHRARIELQRPMNLQIDGEPHGEVLELECEVVGRVRVASA
jgi:diacylglycerol kinase (ATP)